jgi:hypothetical protein
MDSNRRSQWQEVLDAEVERWSAMSCEELLASLRPLQSYEVERHSRIFQVEVELLENTDRQLHVLVAVDDGGLPASLMPLTRSFLREKQA